MNVKRALFNLKIRVKLLLAFGSLLILSTLLVVIFFQIIGRLQRYEYSSEKADAVSIHLLELDGTLRYFMYEGYKKTEFQKDTQGAWFQRYQRDQSLIGADLDSLVKTGLLPSSLSIDLPKQTLPTLETHVRDLISLYKQRGFKDFGLEGALREAIHQVENTPYPYSKADMLMLRRHEKDFFLRKDKKYLDEFIKRLETLKVSIQTNPLTEGKDRVLKDLESYQNKFKAIVEVEERLGLTETSGLKGMITSDLTMLKENIHTLRTAIKTQSASYRQRARVWLMVILLVQLGLGILLAVTYSHVITRAVKELQRAMKSLAEGIFPAPLTVKSQEEIGQTKMAFNQLIERMKAATSFSTALGQGDLTTRYDQRFTDDILAKALLTMQQQLHDAQEKQRVINWVNYGSAQLNDILKTEYTNLESLGDQLMKMLVAYLPANQGALYIVQKQQGEEYLECIATYAYNKKKYLYQRIEIGQGLVGQVVLEHEPTILTQVPDDYIKITSGLGEATPRFVVIVPLIFQNRVMGVIEFASFDILESYKIDFLKKISENIASILMNKKINTETTQLLAEAKEKEQRLAAQEEELRQNAEEMQAVQEQMERQQRELEDEVRKLRKQGQGEVVPYQ